MTQKIYLEIKKLCHHQTFFLLKNIFKVALHNLFYVFILFNTVSYLKLNLKLDIDPKMCILKTCKKFGKPGKNLEKTSGNPDHMKIKT